MENPFLHIEDLCVGYKSKDEVKKVFEHINFTAFLGETIALIGHNGVGKSTFLRTISNLQSPLNGSFTIDNKNFTELNVQELAKTLSFVSTEIIQVSRMTVFELVALGRYPYTNWFGKLTKEDEEKCLYALELVGMKGFVSKEISNLSDGERQRVMIARTLAQDTKVVILDEPTAFLDLKNKYEIIDLLNTISRKENKLFIYSTHDLHIALQSADKIWLMTDEKAIQGAPEDIILNHHLDQLFDSKKLSFDISKFNFVFNKDIINSVHLTGKGSEFELTKNALKRVGIEHSLQSSVKIEVNSEIQSKWIVNTEKAVLEFTSIYDLIYYLKKNIF